MRRGRNNLIQNFLASVFLMSASAVPAQENNYQLTTARITELNNLLLQDCGSCHGMTMKGGLGPALTADVLRTKDRALIETTILNGRPGTPMPPWNTLLSGEEVRWIVDTLYAGVKQ
jgi:cytochrome c55X